MNIITISLCDLRFYAFHGVMEQEATVGNEFQVDVELTISSSELEMMVSTGEEDLAKTISYADVFDVIKTEMTIKSQLLETVAIRIANNLQSSFPRILSGKVIIKKLAPPIPSCNGSAAVTYLWDLNDKS